MQDESKCYKCGGDLVVRARYTHTIVAKPELPKVNILARYDPIAAVQPPASEDMVVTTGVDYFCISCGEANAAYTISADEAARNGILYSEDLVNYFTR